MPSFVRALAWGAMVFALACTAKTDSPPSAGGSDPRPPGAVEGTPKLEGRVFLSQRVTENGTPRTLVAGSQLLLSFSEGKRVGANAGCNSMGGRYSITDGKLVISDGAITEMACEGLLDQEGWYMKLLQSSPTIAVDGDTLVIETGGTRIEYLDREKATPDVALVGRTWTVDTVVANGMAQHAQWPAPATLELAADGSVKLHTSCNAGSSTYRVEGKEITFTGASVTKMGCSDPLIRAQEDAMLGLLRGPQPVTWEITVDRLSLRGKDFGLELKASGG